MAKKEKAIKLKKLIRRFEMKCEHSLQEYLELFEAVTKISPISSEEMTVIIKDGIYGEGNWGNFKDEGPHWSDKPITDKSNDPT